MQCVTQVWVIHFGDKLRSRQTLKGSTPFSSCWVFTLLNSLCCSELGKEELSEDELVFNSSCMSFLLQAFSMLDWSQGHCMKWGAGKRQRERERDRERDVWRKTPGLWFLRRYAQIQRFGKHYIFVCQWFAAEWSLHYPLIIIGEDGQLIFVLIIFI